MSISETEKMIPQGHEIRKTMKLNSEKHVSTTECSLYEMGLLIWDHLTYKVISFCSHLLFSSIRTVPPLKKDEETLDIFSVPHSLETEAVWPRCLQLRASLELTHIDTEHYLSLAQLLSGSELGVDAQSLNTNLDFIYLPLHPCPSPHLTDIKSQS